MKLFSKLLSALLLLLFSAASLAQNYYVCDSNGSDDFDGRSEAKPFKTYDKAILYFNKLDVGGSLLFCRGGKFEANIVAKLANSSCAASEPCSIGDYGNPESAKPIISANGVHAINFENGGDAKQDGGYVVKNLTLIAAIKSGAGIRLYNDVDDVTIQNIHVEGFNIGVYSGDSKTPLPGSSANGFNDRLHVKDSTIINNKKIGFLGACNDCLLDNNYFENNGSHPSLDHNIYLAQKNKPAKGITIRNNTLYRSAIVDGKCQGVSLVGHGLLEDVLIENNLIKEDVGKVSGGCWGISIDPGYSGEDEAFRNITIRNNKVVNVGGNGIGCASCEGLVIENNEIIDEGNALRAGVSVPVREENTLKSKNVIIRNNKVIINHEDAYGIKLAGSNPFVASYNEISMKGSQMNSLLSTETQSNSRCFMLSDANANTDVSINSCGTHTSVSIIDEATQPEVDESAPIDVVDNEVPNDTEENENSLPVDDTEVVLVEPIDEPTSNVPSPEDALQTDETGSQIVEVEPVNEPVFTEQPEQEQIIDSDTQITDTGNLVTTPTKQNRSDNGNQNSLNISETGTDSTTTTGTKPRKAAGGSSGGGSSSKSSDSSSTLSSTDEQESVTDGVAYFETQPITNSFISSEISGTSITESTTIQSSSPSITKMKDVIHAKQEDLSNFDPSQCRASANGKCLMK